MVEIQSNASICYHFFNNKIKYLKIFKKATKQQYKIKFRDQGPYSTNNINKKNSSNEQMFQINELIYLSVSKLLPVSY